jgi:predicted nucleic-acid-binding Zn-ribbon protein
MNLECPKCGNKKNFNRDVSVYAKLKVDKNGKDLKGIFNVNKNHIDGWYEPIYCNVCGTQVGEDS